jgi:hypothetical protein
MRIMRSTPPLIYMIRVPFPGGSSAVAPGREGSPDAVPTCLSANMAFVKVSNGTRKVAIFKAPVRATAGYSS